MSEIAIFIVHLCIKCFELAIYYMYTGVIQFVYSAPIPTNVKISNG